MTTTETMADLWRHADAQRGRAPVAAVVQSWLHARIDGHQQGALSADLLYAIIEMRLDWPGGEHYTPRPLTSFIGKLASGNTAQSVLDPSCGLGLLLHEVAASAGSQVVHGIDINHECGQVAQALLGKDTTILVSDALASPAGLRSTYDLIVANPPFGLNVRCASKLPHLDGDFRGDLGHALAVWACSRLSDRGTAMFILTSAFLWSKHGLQAQEAVRKSGCRVRALIHLPGGTFSHTGISTYLAVFERGEQEEVFIGEFSESPDHQKSLIENLRRRKAGEHPALGRMCLLANFRGFDALVAKERLNRLVRAAGWVKHAAEAVIVNAARVNALDGGDTRDSNSLYLRLIGRPVAVLDAADLPKSALRESVCLSIDSTIADARYLAHWFNQSPIGQTTVATVAQGGTLPRLDLTALLKAGLYLPPLAEQRQFLQSVAHLNRIRAEAMELESALWSGSGAVAIVAEKIRTINQEDRYEDWIESLPFPLASILWRHRAGGGSTRERLEILSHFFEATAAFVATIHLSAFMADDALWRDVAPGLSKSLLSQKLSLDKATFGAWKVTAEYLSGRCKKLLSDDGKRSTITRVYGTPSQNHVDMLCRPDLLSAIQRANAIRNSFAHGGALGQDDAQGIHDELLTLVHTLRGVFGRSWVDYELIQPSQSRFRGGVYKYTASRLVGTRSAPFEVVERESVQPLESDRLYLFDAAGQSGLLLRPFIRVMPSPEKKANACFIFSRCEQGGARFVSYHFEQESSMTAQFPDIDETFQRIHSFDDRAELL
jgi:hypothetical protein